MSWNENVVRSLIDSKSLGNNKPLVNCDFCREFSKFEAVMIPNKITRSPLLKLWKNTEYQTF